MSIDRRSGKLVNCAQCIHYNVTWDPMFPRGCGLFGFKTARPPSTMVLEATGGRCDNFKSRLDAKPKPARRDVRAKPDRRAARPKPPGRYGR